MTDASPAVDASLEGVENPEITDGESALGDAGKKALDAMKAERNAARVRVKELEAQLAGATPAEPADDIDAKIQAAVAAALESQRPQFHGTADSGAARSSAGPSQLTREDLSRMNSAEIAAAKRAGRLDNLLQGK